MMRFPRLPTAFVIAIFWLPPAFAQTAFVPDDLGRLAGCWAGETILHTPQGEISGGAGALVARAGPGSSIIIDYEAASGRFAGFRIHEVISWEVRTGRVSMVWIDSANSGLTVQTGRIRGNELVFTPAEAPAGDTRESAMFGFGPDSFTIESRAGPPGALMRPVLTLRFRRMRE